MADIPKAPPKFDTAEEARFRDAVRQALEGCVPRRQSIEMVPGAYVYMRSPDGERWQISVSNAGAIVVTAA
jgi:hypothetical protein